MNKLFNKYILSGLLTASAGNVNAGTNMTGVMERVEQKGLIRFTDLDAKNQALMAAYGHFMPFDKVTITRNGEIIKLTDDVIDDIIRRGYGVRDFSGMPIATGVDTMLTTGEDFYVAANNGSFKLVVENAHLVGTSDEEPKTPFTDFSINTKTGEYFRDIADSRDAVATEAYNLFNNVDSLEISIRGPKTLVAGILPDRLGSEIRTNSSREDVRNLVTKIGLYTALDRVFEASGELDMGSETKLNMKKSGDGFDYNILVVNAEGTETSMSGRIDETSFWHVHEMQKPSKDVTRNYLGLEEAIAAIDSTETQVADADSTGNMRFTIIGGGSYPLGVTAGVRGAKGDNFFEAYGGVNLPNGSKTPAETFPGQTTPVGRRIDLETTTSTNPAYGLLAGARIGHEFSNGWNLSLGGYGGFEDVESVENTVSRDYRGSQLIETRNLEPFRNSQLAKLIGAEAGVGKGRYSGHLGLDSKKQIRGTLQYHFGGKSE